jgi:hypothetical protein
VRRVLTGGFPCRRCFFSGLDGFVLICRWTVGQGPSLTTQFRRRLLIALADVSRRLHCEPSRGSCLSAATLGFQLCRFALDVLGYAFVKRLLGCS